MGVEGDLKIAQDNAADLERAKRELEAVIAAKEKNNLDLQAKLDDEQGLVAKNQKTIKELQGRVEALEEELEAERQSRAKAERQRSDLAREIEGLGDRLNEASGATAAQVELNKKREAEIAKLRKDVEEANIQQESVLGNLKRKQGDSVGEMSDQVDALQKMKAKIDKDKITIMNEIADVRAATDEVMRAQASVDKANHNMLDQLNAINKKVDEARERQLLLGKFRNLEHELDGAKEVLDEEVAARENTLRLVAKAEGDAGMWRQKYEAEAVAKAEELEMTNMKLKARLTEAEAAV